MPSEVLFSNTIVVLEKLLDFQSQRHSLLSANVANVDTPGYKGFDLEFSDELKKAVGSKGTLPLRRTNERHLPQGANRLSEVKGNLVSRGTTRRRDGNTVDLDKEMAKLAENNLYYNTAAQLISKKMNSLRNAILPR